MWNPFQRLVSKRFLGIDIGTSSVKMVEVSRSGYRKKLENYGQLASYVFQEKPFRTFDKSFILLSNEEIARAIKAIIEEAGIKTDQAIFSIPDFSSFFTSFKLPPMTKEELPQAIKYEAKQHIPLPLAEVVLDWQIIESYELDKEKSSFKILLAAVPNEIVRQYQEIARISNLELVALEAEVFSLIRSLSGEKEKELIAIIDIGVQSTTCSIVEKGILKISHSFDISDNDLTSTLSSGLSIGLAQAEKIKKQYGIKEDGDPAIKEILSPLIDIIINEIKEIFGNFYKQEKRKPEKIIISGGTVLTPGLKEYFEEAFAKEKVEVGNPFSGMIYPSVLEKPLAEIGPSFAIAAGAALRGLQN